MSKAMVVPQTSPKAGYVAHQVEIDEAVRRVLESGWYILGHEVELFEQEFAEYVGTGHAIGVANGTDALELALRSCKIGPGDLVFTVSHTAVATVAAIELVGATPVFVDIDLKTYTIDPNCIEVALKNPPKGTPKAIIPVHLYGHPANMPAVLELANRFGLIVIEDCAQSHGASLQKRRTGTWGHMAAFSFYPTKNLGTFGDGGAVVTDDAELAEKARTLREYGWRERFVSSFTGMNSRLDELHAAILRVKLQYLDEENERRRTIAAQYSEVLRSLPIRLPEVHPDVAHVYHQYVIGTVDRDGLRTCLKSHGIATAIHYPVPVHLQPAYRRLTIRSEDLLHTEQAAREILSLPMFAQLTDQEVRFVTQVIQGQSAEKESLN